MTLAFCFDSFTECKCSWKLLILNCTCFCGLWNIVNVGVSLLLEWGFMISKLYKKQSTCWSNWTDWETMFRSKWRLVFPKYCALHKVDWWPQETYYVVSFGNKSKIIGASFASTVRKSVSKLMISPFFETEFRIGSQPHAKTFVCPPSCQRVTKYHIFSFQLAWVTDNCKCQSVNVLAQSTTSINCAWTQLVSWLLHDK